MTQTKHERRRTNIVTGKTKAKSALLMAVVIAMALPATLPTAAANPAQAEADAVAEEAADVGITMGCKEKTYPSWDGWISFHDGDYFRGTYDAEVTWRDGCGGKGKDDLASGNVYKVEENEDGPTPAGATDDPVKVAVQAGQLVKIGTFLVDEKDGECEYHVGDKHGSDISKRYVNVWKNSDVEGYQGNFGCGRNEGDTGGLYHGGTNN